MYQIKTKMYQKTSPGGGYILGGFLVHFRGFFGAFRGGGTFRFFLVHFVGGGVHFGGVYGTIGGVSGTHLRFLSIFCLVFVGHFLGFFLISSGSEWGVGDQAGC